MSVNIANKVVSSLDQNMVDDEIVDPDFVEKGVVAKRLTKDSFKLIEKYESDKKIAFIDGGNLEILTAPNFSVHLNRLYASVWNGVKRQKTKIPRVEYISLTYTKTEKEKLTYKTEIFPYIEDTRKYLPEQVDLEFDSFDRTLSRGSERADIQFVGTMARKFGEWKFAEMFLDFLDTGDMIVMDGSLQTHYTNEEKYLDKLKKASISKGIILSALSKTSKQFTKTGNSLIGSVNNLAKKNKVESEWICQLGSNEKDDYLIFIIKLSDVLDRVFRFDIQKTQYLNLKDEEKNMIFTKLIENASDATLPGYPYGLIDADRLARVSNNEIEYYRRLFTAVIKKSGKEAKFMSHLQAIDTHSMLDNMVGR